MNFNSFITNIILHLNVLVIKVTSESCENPGFFSHNQLATTRFHRRPFVADNEKHIIL